MYYSSGVLYWSCGITEIGNFERETNFWNSTQKLKNLSSGTGFFIASFIPNEKSKLAYEEMTTKMKLVYQSPVRKNRNSGHQFLFCIFDKRKS